ncbi:MAG: sensor histidine kinase [Minwuia sp.]|uniref:sensor histidine kinase n=1 Tax=Minwuia sp. TaxID=2493630 RepID=UPI003A888145
MIARYMRSMWTRLAVIAAVLLIAPVIIYNQLQSADQERSRLLRQSVAAQGRITAEALRTSLDPARLPDLNDVLGRFETPGTQLRLLYRPAGEAASAFYFVAAAPALPAAKFEAERAALLQTASVAEIGRDCVYGFDRGSVYDTVSGDRRVIASIVTVVQENGCWAVILTRQEVARFGPDGTRPYWQSPEMIISAVVYVAMVGLVLLILLSLRRDLKTFARTARRAGEGEQDARFQDLNRLPELDGVAVEFDRMVANLRRSAEILLRLSEENAHALKTPVGVIAQALEPLRKAVEGDQRRTRSAELIENSVDRLDHLITVIRRSEEAAAALVSPRLRPLDAGALARDVVDAYRPIARDRGIELGTEGLEGILFRGNADLLRIAIENPIENALELTPRGGRITVTVLNEEHQQAIEIRITDTGPGVDDHALEQIFDRKFSGRKEGDEGHDGLGLWIVRRNMEAMGGTAHAENEDDGGLSIVLRGPAAR